MMREHGLGATLGGGLPPALRAVFSTVRAPPATGVTVRHGKSEGDDALSLAASQMQTGIRFKVVHAAAALRPFHR
jgi:hypothetical protein